MPSPSPAVRAFLFGAVAVTLVCLGATWLHLNTLPAELSPETIWITVVWVVALWGLLLGSMAAMAWYTGPYTFRHLERLAVRLAEDDAPLDAVMQHAEGQLGPMATVFVPLVQRLDRASEAIGQAQEHIRALYQVNPHYVVLCSLDGCFMEANPAFFALTGLAPDIRGQDATVALDGIFPLGPLQDLAVRSLREQCSIQGIDYGIVGQDGKPRAVQVSLRAFALDEKDVVLIQATDVAAQRSMEQRIHAFSDTLDLMVDQRVAQLNDGQTALHETLDAAGLVLASFDVKGGTRRWSEGARALTGQSVGHVPNVHAVASALGLAGVEAARFSAWFRGEQDGPFVARHTVRNADGTARTRHYLWHKSGGHPDDLRTILGLELPLCSEAQATAAPLSARAVVRPVSPAAFDSASGKASREGHPGGASIPVSPTRQHLGE